MSRTKYTIQWLHLVAMSRTKYTIQWLHLVAVSRTRSPVQWLHLVAMSPTKSTIQWLHIVVMAGTKSTIQWLHLVAMSRTKCTVQWLPLWPCLELYLQVRVGSICPVMAMSTRAYYICGLVVVLVWSSYVGRYSSQILIHQLSLTGEQRLVFCHTAI